MKDWCTNNAIKRTIDFTLKKDGVGLFGFHDTPDDFWAALSEHPFVERLAVEKIIKYKVLLESDACRKRINKKSYRWVWFFIIVILLCIFLWIIAEYNPYRKELVMQMAQNRKELVMQVAQITDSNIVNWKAQLSNSASPSWIFKDYAGIYEKGILRLQDGTIVKFSFISHHVSNDHESHSYFSAPHFSKHVTGWFCCEVDFDKQQQPKDLKELDSILSGHDGVSP